MDKALLVAASLAVILILIRLKVQNGLAMAAGGVIVVLFSGMGPTGLVSTAWNTVKSTQTLNILGTMLMVMALEQIMSRYGLIDRIIGSLGRLIPDKRVHMVILPMFMGLLPSAGGALLSCPMVEKAADGTGAGPEKQAFANFWFRHMMEFIVPIYTALIILTQITGTSIALILRSLFPVAAVATAAGLPVAFMGSSKARPLEPLNGRRRDAVKGVALSLLPIVAVIVLVVGFGLNPTAAIVPSVIALLVVYRPKAGELKKMAANVLKPGVIFMVIGIMFYKEALTGSGGIEALASAFSGFGLPMQAMVMALPFAVGFLTGMSSVTVAITLPILFTMYGTGAINAQLAALAYASCVMGMNLTPTHLCLVLTVGYFKVDLVKVIGMIVMPAAATLAAAFLLLA